MAAADTDVDRVDLTKPITLTTFHPDWETIDKNFWVKRILLIIFAVPLLLGILWVGFNLTGSKMFDFFSSEAGPVKITEFALWYVDSLLFIEMVQIANHKTRTTRIKYKLSKNEEMRVSITFNRSLALLFVGIFIFTFLKIIIRYIWGYSFWNSNIWRYLRAECSLQEWVINALYVCIGFLSYAQFLYVFEKIVQGRKHPFLWFITPVGLFLMIFLPPDFILFTITFTSTIKLDVQLYYFGQWFAMSGGIIIPVLYLVMGRRFAYSGHAQTSKDCYRKGVGFAIAAIGAVFDINVQLFFASWGGILAFMEALLFVFTAPILTFVGIILVRTAYRPRG